MERPKDDTYLRAGIAIVVIVVLLGLFGLQTPQQSLKSQKSVQSFVEVPADVPAAPVKITPAELRISRKSYAAGLDSRFIENGVESTTTTSGAQDTTLRITYALTGRVAANQIGKSLDFDHLKELGFKKVVLTNGFEDELNETFTWTVK